MLRDTCAIWQSTYYGIVQLITLSNGIKVEKEVSSKQSATFLDNAGDAKIEAAKELLNATQKTFPENPRSLENSRHTLIDSWISLERAPTKQLISRTNPRSPFQVGAGAIPKFYFASWILSWRFGSEFGFFRWDRDENRCKEIECR